MSVKYQLNGQAFSVRTDERKSCASALVEGALSVLRRERTGEIGQPRNLPANLCEVEAAGEDREVATEVGPPAHSGPGAVQQDERRPSPAS